MSPVRLGVVGELYELPLRAGYPPPETVRSNGGSPAIRAISLADVRRERMDTLFDEGRIPLGEITELTGFEGEGKGLTSVMIAARLSHEQKHTLFLSGEDSPGATIRPRLEAAGADLRYTSVMPMEAILELPNDGDKLLRLAADVDAAFVVIDPLVSFLGSKVNSWNDHQVRLALAPLRMVAAELRCAMLVIRHLNKGQSEHVRDRSGGSIAFRAFARSALLLGRDPDDPEGEDGPRRVLVHSKCNFGPTRATQVFKIEAKHLPATAEDDASDTARLNLVGISNVRSSQLLQRMGLEERADQNDVDTFVLELLEGGDWVEATVIDERGKEADFSPAQLSKSRTRLKLKDRIEKTKTGQPGEPGKWQWRLKEQAVVA